jgi:hypothetical protein
LLETGPAEHGTSLRGLKGNGGFRGALRTDGPGFCTHAVAGSGHALDFALFATFGIVLELFIVEEELLTSGKNEVVTAVRTFQNLVDEIHYASPRTCLGIFQCYVDASLRWQLITKQLDSSKTRQLPLASGYENERGKW